MHAIIEDNREWQAFQRERARVEAARLKWAGRVARERAAHEAKVRAYNEEVERALLMAEDPDRIKSPGDWRPPAGHAHVFTDRILALDRAARDWAARRQQALSRELQLREAALMGEARLLAERLRALADEVEALRASEDFLRAAAGLRPVVAPMPTPAALLAATAGGASLVRGSGPASNGGALPVDLDSVDIG